MFYFTLALARGCSVRELLRTTDALELTYWRAFYRIHPWGEVRGDLQAGIVAAMVANVHLKEGAKPLSPQDFLLEFGGQPKMATAEEMAAKLRQFTAERGGKME